MTKSPGDKIFETFEVPYEGGFSADIKNLQMPVVKSVLSKLEKVLESYSEHFAEFDHIFGPVSGGSLLERISYNPESRVMDAYEELFDQKEDLHETVSRLNELELNPEMQDLDVDINYMEQEAELKEYLVTDLLPAIHQNTKMVGNALLNKEANLRDYYTSIEAYGSRNFKKAIFDYMKEVYGYDDICDSLDSETNFERIAKTLRETPLSDLPLWNEYREVEKKVKDPETRNKYAHKYKKLKKEMKKMRNELHFFAEFFHPTYETQLANAKSYAYITKNIEKMLHKEGKKTQQSIVVNSEYNPKLDFSAGKVSDDCTDGRPLPFQHEKVHNIKFYLKDKWVGNIYAIEFDPEDNENYKEKKDDEPPTREREYPYAVHYPDDIENDPIELIASERERIERLREEIDIDRYLAEYREEKVVDTRGKSPVLHFEAIQSRILDSETSRNLLPNLVSRVKEEYESFTGKKNVKITVNPEPSAISNYPSIQSAAKTLYTGEKTPVGYPNVELEEGQSGFQGGEAGRIYNKLIIYE